jgi:hypothetical protein
LADADVKQDSHDNSERSIVAVISALFLAVMIVCYKACRSTQPSEKKSFTNQSQKKVHIDWSDPNSVIKTAADNSVEAAEPFVRSSLKVSADTSIKGSGIASKEVMRSYAPQASPLLDPAIDISANCANSAIQSYIDSSVGRGAKRLKDSSHKIIDKFVPPKANKKNNT